MKWTPARAADIVQEPATPGASARFTDGLLAGPRSFSPRRPLPRHHHLPAGPGYEPGKLAKPDDEPLSLEGIAEHHLTVGDTAQGIGHPYQALQIHQRLGMRADIDRVQVRLAAVNAASGG